MDPSDVIRRESAKHRDKDGLLKERCAAMREMLEEKGIAIKGRMSHLTHVAPVHLFRLLRRCSSSALSQLTSLFVTRVPWRKRLEANTNIG